MQQNLCTPAWTELYTSGRMTNRFRRFPGPLWRSTITPLRHHCHHHLAWDTRFLVKENRTTVTPLVTQTRLFIRAKFISVQAETHAKSDTALFAVARRIPTAARRTADLRGE